MAKKITTEEIEHLARLSRVGLKKDEVEKYQKELSQILEYIEKLAELDVSKVEPLTNVTGQTNNFREDEIMEAKPSREELLSNVPDRDDGCIKTKPVL